MIFKIFKIINIKIFIISLLIGLYYIYYIDDKKEIIIYPTLHNNVLYKDKAKIVSNILLVKQNVQAIKMILKLYHNNKILLYFIFTYNKMLNKVVSRLFYSETGKIFLSILLGLGIASLFRKICIQKIVIILSDQNKKI